jgi:hypothetical protein
MKKKTNYDNWQEQEINKLLVKGVIQKAEYEFISGIFLREKKRWILQDDLESKAIKSIYCISTF